MLEYYVLRFARHQYHHRNLNLLFHYRETLCSFRFSLGPFSDLGSVIFPIPISRLMTKDDYSFIIKVEGFLSSRKVTQIGRLAASPDQNTSWPVD